MYTYNSGLNEKVAFSASLTYRWANRGYVEGTFYNSLSYFLGVQKVFGSRTQHSLAFTTWAIPQSEARKVQQQTKAIGLLTITNTTPIGDTKTAK